MKLNEPLFRLSQYINTTVKHGGGSVMVWDFFAEACPASDNEMELKDSWMGGEQKVIFISKTFHHLVLCFRISGSTASLKFWVFASALLI